MGVPVVVLVLLVVGLLLFAVGVVAAIGILITALEAAAILAAVGIFIIGAALVIDRFRPAPGACGLVRRSVLRDTCEGACPPGHLRRDDHATLRPPFPVSRPSGRDLRLPGAGRAGRRACAWLRRRQRLGGSRMRRPLGLAGLRHEPTAEVRSGAP